MAASLEELVSRSDKFLGSLEQLEQQGANEEEELKNLRSEAQDTRASIALLQHISQKTAETQEQQTANLATLALRESFKDRSLTLKVEHDTYRGHPGVTFKLRDEDYDIEDDPMEAFGGGPASLLGVILQTISTVRQPNMTRCLILDEPCAQVSADYAGDVGKLLRKLCEPPPRGLGFDMLVVTHMDSIADAAHRRYHAELDDTGTLRLQTIESQQLEQSREQEDHPTIRS